MKKRILQMVILLIAVAVVTACGSGGGGGAAPAAGGSVEAGKALFEQTTIGSQPGCVTCHSLEAGKTVVGPSLAGIGTAAAGKVSGESAEQFLHNSIVDPNAYVEEGFAQGLMPAFKDALSEQQVKDLVAYLLTLK